MSLPPFQNEVAQFVEQHEMEIRVEDRMLDLTSEIGELAKEILNATGYGRRVFCPDETWRDELGDVFFSLICLANSTDINLSDALRRAMDKYGLRLASKGDAGSGEE